IVSSFFFFFFSSRRRHTRSKRDWSSDVCSSDLLSVPGECYMKPCLATAKRDYEIVQHETFGPLLYLMTYRDFDEAIAIHNNVPRSEERRVGKECRSRWVREE